MSEEQKDNRPAIVRIMDGYKEIEDKKKEEAEDKK